MKKFLEKVKGLMEKLMPMYGWVILIIMIIWDVIVFQGTRLFNTGWHHYSMETKWDDMIPYIKEWIWIYLPLAYAQWILGFILIGRADKRTCFRLIWAEMIAKTICLVFFIFLPTTMYRADAPGTDFLNRWVQSLYDMDPADNLFPSIHCLESWIIFRSCFYIKFPKWVMPVQLVISILVFASTLFLRQHVIADVIGGVLSVEIGLLIMNAYYKRKDAKNAPKQEAAC
ncbi:MAG: phosphatidic acid phosphatase [Clostridiales bacterium]|nr:phosphatidic acid phosphatase [Clostridiales bacterium]